jgi:Predicted hydrolases or acyltransferases (alpha/beta hydrolase superfamily)
VIAPDLRGYGGSAKPATTADHEPYSKRAMARDQIALMRHFGFERFAVAGHDRGGGSPIAWRWIIPTPSRSWPCSISCRREMYRRADMAFGLGYWHWFFLAQPAPLPERMIGADPEAYYFHGVRERFAPEALADYLRFVHDPQVIHAMCEDYRAGATYDSSSTRPSAASGGSPRRCWRSGAPRA